MHHQVVVVVVVFVCLFVFTLDYYLEGISVQRTIYFFVPVKVY